ncbi:MAG: regulatory protein RecX [Patescibacteria group bacterium]|nr:regulatory protein RecX [Patescibacteria group bacterium]MDD5716039.1 regulatory protein RecX [Patescibacteria group bacterium]
MSAPTPDDYQHIKDKILDYLSRQGFSEKKLLQKVTSLKRNYPSTARYLFYTPEHVQKVLDELAAVGLVDDEKYCRDVLRQLQDRKDGLYRIRQKMHRRLIPRPLIEKVLGEWKQSGTKQDYTAIIRETQRKHERLKEKHPGAKEQYTVKRKLYAFLAQKGYGAEEIKEILARTGD